MCYLLLYNSTLYKVQDFSFLSLHLMSNVVLSNQKNTNHTFSATYKKGMTEDAVVIIDIEPDCIDEYTVIYFTPHCVECNEPTRYGFRNRSDHRTLHPFCIDCWIDQMDRQECQLMIASPGYQWYWRVAQIQEIQEVLLDP